MSFLFWWVVLSICFYFVLDVWFFPPQESVNVTEVAE